MKKRGYIKHFWGVLGVTIVWFVAIDKSYFVEACNDCFSNRDIVQYRVFTVPIFEKVVEHNSLISYVALDLGVPCRHRHLERWHKQRWWGLLFCCCPCKSGTTGLSWSENLHYQRNSDKIKLLVKSNPELPEEFYQRVLTEHDTGYWEQLKNKLFLQEPANSESK